jgi:hypothetical protein
MGSCASAWGDRPSNHLEPGPAMHRGSRALTIADLMILVFATAVGLNLGAFWHRALSAELPEFTIVPPRTHSRTLVAGRAISMLLAANLAVIVLRLQKPRLRIRLLLRQPGSVACLASVSALLVLVTASRLDVRTMGGFASPLLAAAWYWPVAVCSAVLASWLALLGGRGWHAGDWVDRTGILVGLGWVGLPIALAIVEFG